MCRPDVDPKLREGLPNVCDLTAVFSKIGSISVSWEIFGGVDLSMPSCFSSSKTIMTCRYRHRKYIYMQGGLE